MRVVSGIQPTGNLHLGNYLGAIRNWVRMQEELDGESECLFFLADMHAISMPHDPAELRKGTLEMAAALIACGIDPDRSVLFNQAQVPQHAELQWLLTGTARMGWLNRMTQWKDKAGKNREGASVALFATAGVFIGQVIAERALLRQQAERQCAAQQQAERGAAHTTQTFAARTVQQGLARRRGGGRSQADIQAVELLPDPRMVGMRRQPCGERVLLFGVDRAGVQAQLPFDGGIQHLRRYRAHCGSPYRAM